MVLFLFSFQMRPYTIALHRYIVIFCLFLLFLGGSSAHASYTPFNTNVLGNIGIGSANPGQRLDVNGSVRATAFFGSASGLTGINSSQWTTTNTNDVYLPNNGNVGLGTTITGGAALSVMNGNVGIGTWVPGSALQVLGNIGFGLTGTPSALTPNSLTLHDGGAVASIDNNSSSSGTALGVYGGKAANSYLILQSVLSATGSGDYIDFEEGNVGIGTVDVMRMANGNVGIGTTAPQAALVVTYGNVGIGTWTAAGGNLIVNGGGNVGIGSAWPGQVLDVQGTVRATAFIGNGSQLTGIGGMQWTTTNTNDVYLPNNGNVGIGTTITSAGAALTVMNGNVGIGTWVPGAQLFIQNISGETPFSIRAPGGFSLLNLDQYGGLSANGNISAGAAISGASAGIQPGTSGWNSGSSVGELTIQNSSSGNFSGSSSGTAIAVGAPPAFVGNLLDLQLNTSSKLAVTYAGNVGIGTIAPTGFEIEGTNVGIGTFRTTTSALTVMSGNVGIGTWVPADIFQVGKFSSSSSGFEVDSSGNVGIGTTVTSNAALTVEKGNVGIGTPNPVGYVQIENALDASSNAQSPSNYPLVLRNPLSTTNAEVGIGFAVSNWSGVPVLGSSITHTRLASGDLGNLNFYTSGATYAKRMVIQYDGNIGIGTTTPQTGFTVMNGNVGIGTWTAGGGALIVSSGVGNVGIGSAWPGQLLDVLGTVRATAFIGNGAGLTGLSTSQWTTTNTNDVYLPSNGNVGLGTTITNAGAALSIMNGNVGIGTWVPASLLALAGQMSWTTGLGSSVIHIAGPSDQNLQIEATAPVQQSASVTGNNLVLKASNATAGTSSGYGTGGAVSITAGNGVFTSGSPYMQPGGAITLTAGSPPGNGGGSAGGAINIYAGAGNSGASGGPGGAVNIFSGNGEAPASGGSITLELSGESSTGSTGAYGNFVVNSPSSTYIQLVGTTGNVGIDTTTVASRLVINGGVGIGTSIVGSAYLGIAAPSGGLIVQNNVGVGTFSPGSILSVNGGIGIGTSLINNNYLVKLAPSGGLIVQGNVGFGTYAPTGALEIEGGSVGVGTAFTTTSGLTVMNGNVGIGTWIPKGTLDVGSTGTICLGGTCNSSWPGSSQWTTTNTHDVYLPSNGNVGLGTSITAGAALSVMNGDVGIGTWVPAGQLDVEGGNVGIGTTKVASPLQVATLPISTTSASVIIGQGFAGGNAGGTALAIVPPATFTGNAIQVIEGGATYFSMNPSNNGVTAGQFNASVSVNSNVFQQSGGAPRIQIGVSGESVGIGTALANDALDIMSGNGALFNNGNVGIGTWIAKGALDVKLGNNVLIESGNLGIGTWVPGQSLDIEGGNVKINSGSSSTSYLYLRDTVNGIGYDGSNFGISGYFGVKFWTNGYGSNLAAQIGTSNNNETSIFYGNVGIGTTTPVGGLSVMNGNVGIGTWVPTAAFQVAGAGNVGINSTNPGGSLDVGSGTICLNHVCDSTWPGGGSSQWTTTNTNDVYLPGNGNVGLGTTMTSSGAALTVMNGNVGIGTWKPTALLALAQGTTSALGISFGGDTDLYRSSAGGLTTDGNLSVSGTLIATAAVATSVYGGLSAGSSLTIDSTSNASKGNIVLGPSGSNVGIGTTNPQGGLIIMNGNVGIGTWVPSQTVSVNGSINTLGNTSNTYLNSTGGNVGIGSTNPGQPLDVNGRIRSVGIGTTVPEPACFKADGTLGYYNTATWQGTCL